jgi:uncharacterized membrane-anchored protein YhcB (DUF1043 family)
MISSLDWIALAIGCFGVCVAVLYWRIGQKAALSLQEAQTDLQKRQYDLEHALEDLQKARRELQEFRDAPPMLTDEELASHLSGLNARISICAKELQVVLATSESSLCKAAEEAEHSREINRKNRFASYRDDLAKANTQIGLYIERLQAAHPLAMALEDTLKSGYIDPLVGHSDIVAIVKVIDALDGEVSPDDAWNSGVRAIKTEFDGVLKARDATKSIDLRAREAARVAAAIAFNKHRGPPITSLEKFRRLKPTGSRDSFG